MKHIKQWTMAYHSIFKWKIKLNTNNSKEKKTLEEGMMLKVNIRQNANEVLQLMKDQAKVWPNGAFIFSTL